MKKEKLSELKLSLKAINDLIIIEEDPMDMDSESGMNHDVVSALKDGKLFIPERYEAFATKFPCRGVVISMGSKCDNQVKVGDRVIFARLGGQRMKMNEKTYITIRLKDIHAIIS